MVRVGAGDDGALEDAGGGERVEQEAGGGRRGGGFALYDPGDLGRVPDCDAGVWGSDPGAEAGFVLLLGHGGAGAAVEAAAFALKELKRSVELDGGYVPEGEAEGREEVLGSAGCGGGEVFLAELAVFLGADAPEIEVGPPQLTRAAGRSICYEYVRVAAVHLAGCFPYSNLKGAETKVVISFGEMGGELTPAIEIKSIAHQKTEEGFSTPCRLVPFETSPFILASSAPEARGHRERDADFLIANRRWMVDNNTKIGIYAEDRQCEPRRHECISLLEA